MNSFVSENLPIDNNLTRKVSASDAYQIACIKGLVAGSINVLLAVFLGANGPTFANLLPASLIGFFGYGLSLVLFVLALRALGTARTGAYFSAAPFIGAALSFVILGETPGMLYFFDFAAMTGGLYLHLTEQHSHIHTHEPLTHTHSHRHDEHHKHGHDFAFNGVEPHTHEHFHPAITHKHPHYPDIHHQHQHQHQHQHTPEVQ